MKILEQYGLSEEKLADAAFALYVGDAQGRQEEALKERFLELLRRNLHEPNIALLIEAAAHLDEVVRSDSGCIFQGADDPEALVADELIGMSIAEYIAGKKGLLNYVRYDKEKPGVIGDLPPFMDDAVGALVAATMTRLFE
jgi:alpha-ribazole phosphatase CobZ